MEDFKLILDGLFRICYKNEKSTDIINEFAKEVNDVSYITKKYLWDFRKQIVS